MYFKKTFIYQNKGSLGVLLLLLEEFLELKQIVETMIRVCFHISPTETKFSRGQIVRPAIRRSSIFFIFGSHWISHTMAGREQPWPSILTQEWSQLVGRWINPKYRSIHLRSAYPRLEWRFTDFNLLCMIRWMPVMNETGLVCCVYREPRHNVRWQWLPPCHQDPWNHNERSFLSVLFLICPVQASDSDSQGGRHPSTGRIILLFSFSMQAVKVWCPRVSG